MTRTEVAEQVANRLRLSKTDVLNVLDTTFDEMILALSAGERVKIAKFGSFRVVEQKGVKYITFKTSNIVKGRLKNGLTFTGLNI